MSVRQHFSQSYREARAKFLAVANLLCFRVENHLHPMLGRDQEQLFMDVALDGPENSDALLLISSGCHGVEGFCGSGIQVALLHDVEWRRAVFDAGVTVGYIHALNPYGFSWWRRTTEENVDLNRNCRDFSVPLPRNPQYNEVASLLVPQTWPRSPQSVAALQRFIAGKGLAAMQAAVSGGQYEHADGLFYGGVRSTWSQVTLRQVLRTLGRNAKRIGWIDLHTGLGPKGYAERIFAGRPETDDLPRARAWWGPDVTSMHDGSSVSAKLTGEIWNVVYEECAHAQYTGIALEYGTLPILEVLDALCGDQWLENQAGKSVGAEQRDVIKRRLRDAFYVDEDSWKRAVVEQALLAARGAIEGLR